MLPYPPMAVLVADADCRFSELLCQHLEARGWRVFAERDGQAATEVLLSQPVHLALLSLGLPIVNGAEVVRTARARGRRFHTVFLDTQDRPEARRTSHELGALAYLVKPFPLHEVVPFLDDAARRPPPAAAARPDGRADPLDDLVPGSRVSLSIRAGPATGIYLVSVAEKGAALSVSVSSDDRSPLYLSLGTPVSVGFATNRGWGEFESRVTGSYVRGSLTEVMLAHPHHVIEQQRRRTTRLSVSLPVRAWPEDSNDRSSGLVSGQTEDIGRLGLRAHFHAPVPSNGLVVLAVVCDRTMSVANLRSRPVWHEILGDTEPPWHRYGFRFVRLDPEMRKHLGSLLQYARTHVSGLGMPAREPTPPDASDSRRLPMNGVQ